MNFIFACILFVFLCWFIFVVNQYHKKLKDKNEIIDGLLKINDEQKQEIYDLRYLNYAKNEAEITKKQIKHSPKSINYDPIAQLVGLTQRQAYARQAAMQQAATQGQYGLNNSIYGLFNKT